MEPEQNEMIKKHLFKLLPQTICSDVFLAFFQSKDILGDSDIQTINAADTNHSKSIKFYHIIQTRSHSFEVLLEALRHTKQSGALSLLDTCASASGLNSSKPARFSRQPVFMKQFRNAKEKTVLIVNSTDLALTCAKICETDDKCKLYSFDEILEFLSCSHPSIENSSLLPVVKCEDDNLLILLSYLDDNENNLVLVGKFDDEVTHPAHCKVNDKFELIDLSVTFRYKIQKSIETEFGIDSAVCIKLLEGIEQDLLIQLIKGVVPSIESLFRNTLPELINYYIPRRVVTRNIISPTIFTFFRGNDIILVKGIQRHELTTLVKGSLTSTSSDVMNKCIGASVHFVVLEKETHFQKIVKFNKKRPVHLVNWEGDKLIWMKSSRSIQTLQQYVDKVQSSQNENKFMDDLLSRSISTKNTVCISDSPGMGKSVLLTKIGHQLQDGEKPGSLGFVVISEIVQQIKAFGNEENLNGHVFLTIAKSLCKNTLGIAYFQRNKHKLANLLLDGFDEINESDFKFAYKILQSIQEVFPDTRMWITTRPHMMPELETCLNVLGYNIQPFEEKDQINFLKSFWEQDLTTKCEPGTATSLDHFAKECLTTIKSKLDSDQEKDIAGIPLQCLLIGEVFKDDAIEYCETEGTELPLFDVKSIADLYNQLVEKKFRKFFDRYDKKDFGPEDLKRAHVYHSISLLFPSFLPKLEKELEPQNLYPQDIFNVGIIESKCLESVPRFIHRTFAEYFLAVFLLDSLAQTWSPEKLDFLLNHVFETRPASFVARDNVNITTNEFRHNVICYFIDTNLYNHSAEVVEIYNESIKVKTLENICEACAYGSYENIFTKIIYPFTCPAVFSDIYSEQLLVICAIKTGLDMFSKVVATFKNINPNKRISDITFAEGMLLHFAVTRGSYSFVEFLINSEGFEESLRAHEERYSYLVHDCVTYSISLNPRTVREKLDIIKYLATIKPSLLISKDKCNESAICCYGIHLDIAKQLLTTGKYELKEVVYYLHRSIHAYSCKEYSEILHFIRDKNLSVNFGDLWNVEVDGNKLIHRLFEYMDMDDKMLDILKSASVSLSGTNDQQQSVLLIAALKNRRLGCVMWLLNNGSFSTEQLNQSFIHFVRSANLDVVRAFIEGKHVRADIIDKGKRNLLHVLLEDTKSKDMERFNVAQVLIQHGVSVKYKDESRKSPLTKLLDIQPNWQCEEWWHIFDLFCSKYFQKANDINFAVAKYLIKMMHVELVMCNYVGAEEHLLNVFAVVIRKLSNINMTDSKGRTLMHLTWISKDMAETYHTVRAWSMLLDNGGNPLLMDTMKNTPICYLMEHHSHPTFALTKRFEQLTEHLFRKMSTISLDAANSAMVLFVRQGNVRLAHDVCQWYVRNINKPVKSIVGNYKGEMVTMLDMAALSRTLDILRHFVVDHACQATLHRFGDSWIQVYLKENFSISAKLQRVTPLQNYTNSMEITEYIREVVKLGINVNGVDVNGDTPLHVALKTNLEKRLFDVLKTLLDCGADANTVTSDHKTPLMLTLRVDHWTVNKVFLLLLSGHADPGRKDLKGNLVLHYLSQNVYADNLYTIVKSLLSAGYGNLFNVQGENELTPLQIARRRFPRHRLMQLFKQFGLLDSHDSRTKAQPLKCLYSSICTCNMADN